MSKRAWYGKAYYFVELPRRFMVSIWGIPVFWKILPDDLTGRISAIVIALGCIAYDLLVVSKAPDLRITRKEIEAKLKEGGRLYYLTTRELTERLLVVALGFAVIAAIVWYWFSHGQQPVLLVRVGVAGTILLLVAYLMKIGIPLRTEREIPAGERPVKLEWVNEEWKTAFVNASEAHSIQFVFGIGLLWIFLWSLVSIDGWKASYGLLITKVMSAPYLIYLSCILIMPMAALKRKISFVHKSLLSHIEENSYAQ